MAKISGFHHTAIRSAAFDASVAFYTGTLGLRTKAAWGKKLERGILIDAGDGNYVEIFERAGFAPAEGALLHFALRTDDCAAILEKVRAAGAEIILETKEVILDSNLGPLPIKIAFFKGPSGELVELFENAIL